MGLTTNAPKGLSMSMLSIIIICMLVLGAVLVIMTSHTDFIRDATAKIVGLLTIRVP